MQNPICNADLGIDLSPANVNAPMMDHNHLMNLIRSFPKVHVVNGLLTFDN